MRKNLLSGTSIDALFRSLSNKVVRKIATHRETSIVTT